jgi:hypothetical protein
MPEHLPLPPPPPSMSLAKRVWLRALVVLSVIGIAHMGYAMQYQDVEPLFGALVLILFVATGVMSGLAVFYINETALRFPEFSKRVAIIATPIFLLAVVIGALGTWWGPYI